jgi:hypothetical protein
VTALCWSCTAASSIESVRPPRHQPPWLSCYETSSLKNSLHSQRCSALVLMRQGRAVGASDWAAAPGWH